MMTLWCSYRRAAWLAAAVLAAVAPAVAYAGTPTPFAPAPDGERVIYRDATLIDGTGTAARTHMDVFVDGERIKSVVPHASTSPAMLAGARIVDLRSRYLMPGLIDSHVHLATPPNRRQAEAMLRRDLYGGVTAVRDMADDLRAVGDLTRASLVGEIAGPDIYYAALMGGPDFFTDPRTIQVSAGGTPGQVPWMQAISEESDLPLAVAMARGTYATAIKLYADLPADLTARITAEAHRQHMRVWAHATLYPAKPSQVVAAGVDAISHACLLVREASTRVPRWSEPHGTVPLEPFRDGRNPALARLFAEMARRGTILDATIWTYSAGLPGTTAFPPLPPGSCDDMVGGAMTGQAFRAGVPISAGTDYVAAWNDPWPDLFHELDALVTKAGMSVDTVLHAATLISARAAGQDRDMGSIEPGKLADMIVLARNPLDGLDNLKSVDLVVKRGRVYKRGDFIPLREGDITDF